MAIYSVGKMINEVRNRKHISQEELGFGICAVSTLSRIESCKQTPGRKLTQAIFERLGLPFGLYNIALSKSEFKRSEIEKNIRDKISSGNYDIEKELEEYEEIGEMDPLEKQFFLLMKGIQLLSVSKDAESSLAVLKEALALSLPGYEIASSLTNKLLYSEELMILNNIAIAESILNKKTTALSIEYSIKEYIENHDVDSEEKAKQYPVILFNISSWEEDLGNYEKAAAAAEEGIDICIKYGKLTYFDLLLFNKGYSLLRLGRDEEGRSAVNQAIYIMYAKKRQDYIDRSVEYIKKELGIEPDNFRLMF